MKSAKELCSLLEKDDLLSFWNRVLDPEGVGLTNAIAADIASWTHEPVPAVLQKMETGLQDFSSHWSTAGVDRLDSGRIEDFYRDQFIEAYDLANWHGGRTTGSPPLSYAWAAQFIHQNNLNRVLDFGSGIGSGVLLITVIGCEVHAADVANRLLAFLEHRCSRRGYYPVLLDLAKTRPTREFYDVIVCFDVLEHVRDPLAKMKELASYLRPGGYLLANFYEDSAGIPIIQCMSRPRRTGQLWRARRT